MAKKAFKLIPIPGTWVNCSCKNKILTTSAGVSYNGCVCDVVKGLPSKSVKTIRKIDRLNVDFSGGADDLMILQKKLSETPLLPHNPQLRKKRDKLTTALMSLARQQGRVSEVNPLAGTDA